MSNLATIVNNILADSGIDDINVVVTTGSYSNPAWITALGWSKISGTPTTIAGYGITDAYTKTEVNNIVANYLPLSGGTMTGDITISGQRIKDLSTTNKGVYIGNWFGAGYWGLGSTSTNHELKLDQVNQATGAWENATDVNLYLGSNRLVLHSVNYSSYALPLTGGTLTGNLELNLGAPTITLTPSGYSGNYRTILATKTNSEAFLQFGNNGVNYIVAGNTLAGGFLEFWVNATASFASGTSGAKALTIASNAAATFNGNVFLSNTSLDVGGIAVVRGNNSLYSTHEFTTGAANVALYDQRNAAGTVINRFNAGGNSYIKGGYFGVGTSSPQEIFHVETSNEYQITWNRTSAGKRWAIGVDTAGTYLSNRTDSVLPLYIANAGAATFNSTVRTGGVSIGVAATANILDVRGENNTYDGTIVLGARGTIQHRDGGQTILSIANDYNSDAAKFEVRMKGNTSADAKLTILGSGAATFSSSVQTTNLLVNTSTNDGYISVNGNNSSRLFYGQAGATFPSANSLFRLDAGGATAFQILGGGQTTIRSSLTVGVIPALNPSGFGYDPNGYKTLILGPTNPTSYLTLCIGVDVSGNPSGAFSGAGGEIVWRNTNTWITPNAANNGYNTLLSWNSSGQFTFSQGTTFNSYVDIYSSLNLVGSISYLTINRSNTANDGVIIFKDAGVNKWILGARGENTNNFYLYSYGTSGHPLVVNYSTGAATFSSTVTAPNIQIGDYTSSPTLTFAATNNGISKINFYDQNNTEGLYMRTDGESYGGTMTFGARWDDDEAKIVFKMYQVSAGATYNARVGIGTVDPAGELTVKRSYNSGFTPIYFGNTSFTAWNRASYDTFVLQQDDVTSFRMVEKNGETTANDQVLTFSIGDGVGRIATSGQPLQFYVNGSPSGLAYQGLSGTQVLAMNTNGNAQFNYALGVTGTVTTTGNYVASNSGIAEIRLQGGGYGGSYNTSLRSIVGAPGVLQMGNNGVNYILAGNTAAGGFLQFRVNCASESTAAGSLVLTLNANATATFASSVTATAFFESSDSRLKTLLENTIDYSLVSQVEARFYEKNGVKELGYFAQDFEQTLPSAIHKDENGFLNLSYTQVHTAKIAALEARVKELENQLKNK